MQSKKVKLSLELILTEEMFFVIDEKCRIFDYTPEEYIKSLVIKDNESELLAIGLDNQEFEDDGEESDLEEDNDENEQDLNDGESTNGDQVIE